MKSDIKIPPLALLARVRELEAKISAEIERQQK
jgi:hypothetical protein